MGLLTILAFFGMVWAILRLRLLATTDELTALKNRRCFLERWQEEVERAKRYKRDLSCLIIDINGFKQINDRAGSCAKRTSSRGSEGMSSSWRKNSAALISMARRAPPGRGSAGNKRPLPLQRVGNYSSCSA